MNAVARKTAMALALALVVLTASSALAAPPRPRLAPMITPPGGGYPKLGFHYQVIPGYGYRILSVSWGTPAARIGLEPGDVVLTINGYPMTYYGAHVEAVQEALYSGGWLSFTVRDVRTGHIVHRGTSLFGGGAAAAAISSR